jgi:hypothetical protein
MKSLKHLPRAIKTWFKPKIFCISVQRTGTTSVGQFFIDHGYPVATWNYSRQNEWSLKWFKGDYEAIFKSNSFRFNQVFEDDPWWCGDFYRVLFHRFPSARFILIERDADRWFDSMKRHSHNRNLGNAHMHATLYNRLGDFYRIDPTDEQFYSAKIDNLLSLDESHRDHYTSLYHRRNREVIHFFDSFGKERLCHLALEDKDKWQKLGSYFSLQVDPKYDVHVR